MNNIIMNKYLLEIYGFIASDIIDDYKERGLGKITKKVMTLINNKPYHRLYLPLVVDVEVCSPGKKPNSYIQEIEESDVWDMIDISENHKEYLRQFLTIYPQYKNVIKLRKLKSKSFEDEDAFNVIFPPVFNAIVVDYSQKKFYIFRHGTKKQSKLKKYSLDDITNKKTVIDKLSPITITVMSPFSNDINSTKIFSLSNSDYKLE